MGRFRIGSAALGCLMVLRCSLPRIYVLRGCYNGKCCLCGSRVDNMGSSKIIEKLPHANRIWVFALRLALFVCVSVDGRDMMSELSRQ